MIFEMLPAFGRHREPRRSSAPALLLGVWLAWCSPALPVQGEAPTDDEAARPSWADRTGPEAFGIDLARTADSILLETALHELLSRHAAGEGGFPEVLDDWHQEIFERAAGETIDRESFARLTEPLGGPVTAGAVSGTSGDRDLRMPRPLPGERCLGKIHEALIAEVLALEGEALLPLVWLYFDDYLDNAAERPWLARFAHDLAVDLLERLPGARGDGDRLLAAFYLLWAEPYLKTEHYDDGLRAIDLIGKALDHVPDHPVALYWSGFMLEKYGYYGRALRSYERLLALEDGDDPEVRARIAINQLRQGNERQGIEGLRALARSPEGEASGVPPWLRRIAYGELARELGEDDPAAAVALLRQALDLLGDDPNLRIQLAYHLRTVDWGETVGHLRRVEHAGAAGGLTARGLYDLPREEGLRQVRKDLVGEVVTARPALARALEQVATRWSEVPDQRPELELCEGLAHPQDAVDGE